MPRYHSGSLLIFAVFSPLVLHYRNYDPVEPLYDLLHFVLRVRFHIPASLTLNPEIPGKIPSQRHAFRGQTLPLASLSAPQAQEVFRGLGALPTQHVLGPERGSHYSLHGCEMQCKLPGLDYIKVFCVQAI